MNLTIITNVPMNTAYLDNFFIIDDRFPRMHQKPIQKLPHLRLKHQEMELVVFRLPLQQRDQHINHLAHLLTKKFTNISHQGQKLSFNIRTR